MLRGLRNVLSSFTHPVLLLRRRRLMNWKEKSRFETGSNFQTSLNKGHGCKKWGEIMAIFSPGFRNNCFAKCRARRNYFRGMKGKAALSRTVLSDEDPCAVHSPSSCLFGSLLVLGSAAAAAADDKAAAAATEFADSSPFPPLYYLVFTASPLSLRSPSSGRRGFYDEPSTGNEAGDGGGAVLPSIGASWRNTFPLLSSISLPHDGPLLLLMCR